MSKETINIVKKFLNSYSIETTPNVYEKYGSFTEFLHKNHDIYITYLPDENSKNVNKLSLIDGLGPKVIESILFKV